MLESEIRDLACLLFASAAAHATHLRRSFARSQGASSGWTMSAALATLVVALMCNTLVLLVVVVRLGAAQAMPLASSPAPPPVAASTMSARWQMACVDGTQEEGSFESIVESMASRGVKCTVEPLVPAFVGAGRHKAPKPQASPPTPASSPSPPLTSPLFAAHPATKAGKESPLASDGSLSASAPSPALLSSKMGCEWWFQRWNQTRQAALAGHRPAIEFVHVPKAAGHTIEKALSFAFHGCVDNATCPPELLTSSSIPRRKGCTMDTSDCENFHGGHHPMVHRNNGRGSFITTLREPTSALISMYNDIGVILSTRCTNIEYCTSRVEMEFCKPGTGMNFPRMIADGRNPHNASDVVPCVAAKPFIEWAVERLNKTADRLAFRKTQSYWVQERDFVLHPRNYVLIGIATPQSVSAFVQRLHYVYSTPYDPTPMTTLPSSTARTAAGRLLLEGSASRFKIFRPASLTEDDRHRLANSPLFQRDQLSFVTAQVTDDEQQNCFREFAKDLGEG